MSKIEKKKTISIGIPAFNEERGIKNILEDILAQKRFKEWDILEILVYCDGCTDHTVSEASSVRSPLIQIIDGKKRLGKTARLQQMFKEIKGDFLVMVDADVRLGNEDAINELFKQFTNPDVMYVAGNVRPETPVTFVQKAVYSSFEVFDAMRRSMNHGDNLYCCGQTFALRRDFLERVKFPPIINEDTYLYLLCKQFGFKFMWARKAHILYKLPLNFKDYMKQILRSQPAAFTTELRPYFPEIIDQEAARDKKKYLIECGKSFLKNPVGVVAITLLNLLSLPLTSYIITHYKMKWFTAESTH
jgi:cellulose synthase/poly-beta-1,6-N-acetylglucosamine synthase-like glycosyltransferase